MTGVGARDRDPLGRPRNARPRDEFGRPLPKGTPGVERVPDDYAPSAGRALADAAAYLDEGRPFHAHEVLEARWKTGPERERPLWQGLAQICVGLTHLQRGNARGAAALLGRGAARVSEYAAREPHPGAPDLAEAVRVARGLAERPPDDPADAIGLLAGVLKAG
ncbi:hypothetical protein Ssi03_47910 [Sphaerisporangium siamense]|uniref:DUF309 domain-containing protein n=1 Tax=Sphaerisporangium siamense TaxID=795645 RepID=A0A7W7D2L2_9ACTN|nr:DUF309 domain-containing protein [Sphaerisporangium siamense]MBB4699072.1 hypothetical protein [Sphaerisporangium siamense]GII86801.1 hypothetical protein Ssi03_47910 [Sphaerisporangium siamense]